MKIYRARVCVRSRAYEKTVVIDMGNAVRRSGKG